MAELASAEPMKKLTSAMPRNRTSSLAPTALAEASSSAARVDGGDAAPEPGAARRGGGRLRV
jgi:hypothetical protein